MYIYLSINLDKAVSIIMSTRKTYRKPTRKVDPVRKSIKAVTTHRKSIVKFVRFNRFDNSLFLASPDIDQKSYDTFCTLSDSLEQNFPDTYRHVYKNNRNICYVQTLKHHQETKEGETYEIEWLPILKKKVNFPDQHYVAIKVFSVKHIPQQVEEYEF